MINNNKQLNKKKQERIFKVLRPEDVFPMIADDENAQYPIFVSCIEDQTTASWQINNSEELLDTLRSPHVKGKTLSKLCKTKVGTYIDLRFHGAIYPNTDEKEWVKNADTIEEYYKIGDVFNYYTSNVKSLRTNVNLAKALREIPKEQDDSLVSEE